MKIRELAGAVALASLPALGLACGPDFPPELLQDRAATMRELPEGAFYFEAARLVVPAQRWNVVEAPSQYTQAPNSRQEIEQGWWGDQTPLLEHARSAADAQVAYDMLAGVAQETRQYVAGAAAFEHQDFAGALRRFDAVLALPESERTHYSVWAEYMRGRAAAAAGNGDLARQAYQATRERVRQGAQDPLGVAAASLGDEAKVELDAGADARAIALYAQQAALGSPSGRVSLLAVARAIVADDARLERAVSDPLAQRLLVAYLFSRADEVGETRSEPGLDEQKNANAAPPDKIVRFLAAVEKAGLDRVQGVDRLAALAYRSGRFDLAAALAPKDDSGLAWWVRAKLALRSGDAAAAADAYAHAAKAFPAREKWGREQMMIYVPTRPQCRVEGERGALALSRGEYVQAMEHLYNASSQYWNDAAYVAERVLSVDELKAFVDAHVSQPSPPAPPSPQARDDEEEGDYWRPQQTASALRALLARRLLRADRFDEAPAYFDDAELRAKAVAYIAARRAGAQGDRIERAKALYAAAYAARVDGMELIGYELDPDFKVYGGDFAWGGHDAVEASPWVGKDEPVRVAASRATPPNRYHYRYYAVDFAQKAADLLPPRSQAFAAVLCHATGWLIDRDPDVAQTVYRRYVRQGPYVPWAEAFGRDCPAPDFPAAAARLGRERVAHIKHLARKSLPYAAAAGALVIVLGVLWLQRRRARRAAAEDKS